MRWLTIVVAVLGLALVGAGCGSGEDEASDEPDVTIETVTTETETEGTETEGTETGGTETTGTGSTGDITEDCLAAVAAFAALSQAVGAAGDGTGADDSAARFSEFADRAPDEIKDDILVIADAYRAYIERLSDLDFQPGDTPSPDQIAKLAEASAMLNTAEITEASQNFNTWATANCS